MTARGRVLERGQVLADGPTPMELAGRRITDRALAEQARRRREVLAEAADLIREQPGQVGVWIRQIERGLARRAARAADS